MRYFLPMVLAALLAAPISSRAASLAESIQAEYDAHIQELTGCPEGSTLAECGEIIYTRAGCNACHGASGEGGIGPLHVGQLVHIVLRKDRRRQDGGK